MNHDTVVSTLDAVIGVSYIFYTIAGSILVVCASIWGFVHITRLLSARENSKPFSCNGRSGSDYLK